MLMKLLDVKKVKLVRNNSLLTMTKISERSESMIKKADKNAKRLQRHREFVKKFQEHLKDQD